jgi:multicomponent Na+:H+ antiporter subunit E
MFLLNVLLAVIWMIFRNSFQATDFLVGFLLSFLVISVIQYALRQGRYGTRVFQAIGLAFFCTWAIMLANIAIAQVVLTRKIALYPGIVAIPLDVRNDAAVTLLAFLITLIPGTVSLGASDDRSTLYVHSIIVYDPDTFRQTIKAEFERRVARLLPDR